MGQICFSKDGDGEGLLVVWGSEEAASFKSPLSSAPFKELFIGFSFPTWDTASKRNSSMFKEMMQLWWKS